MWMPRLEYCKWQLHLKTTVRQNSRSGNTLNLCSKYNASKMAKTVQGYFIGQANVSQGCIYRVGDEIIQDRIRKDKIRFHSLARQYRVDPISSGQVRGVNGLTLEQWVDFCNVKSGGCKSCTFYISGADWNFVRAVFTDRQGS